jgi:hypothetical protein
MLVVICPGFSSIYFLKIDEIKIFGFKEDPKPLCPFAICAKSSSTLPILDETC